MNNLKPLTFDLTTLHELRQKYQGRRIPYFELLRTHEWYDSRVPILNRDGHQCTRCHTPKTEYAWGRNVYWVKNYDNKVLRNEFWDKWEAFRKTPGNEGMNLQPVAEDYIPVPEYEFETMVSVDKPHRLHVHHKLYFEDVWPWDYDPAHLITLCNWCHADVHATENVPFYRKINNQYTELSLTPCSRCLGAGFLPQFSHRDDGICYRCNGHRYDEFIVRSERKC